MSMHNNKKETKTLAFVEKLVVLWEIWLQAENRDMLMNSELGQYANNANYFQYE